ncbi:MAG: hypothetical protein IPN06_20200 [Burkholderiales bacterium]|nr:hypothetical protein [Burkholderiales bacterium]
MITPNIEGLMALADRYATLRIGEGTANARKELHDAMQSQAERIKELEAEIITRTSYGDEQTDFAIKLAAERDALRAELDAIAATELVAKLKPCKEGWFIDLDNPPPITGETIELFTRPMPAQNVTELVEALEKLARLGNGEHYGNSDGNMIARMALSRYKGAK